MSEQSLHVRIVRERDCYQAQVEEWPGCFASGETWEELTEAIEEAIGLYMTFDDQEEPTQVALRIFEIAVEADSDLPLIRAMAEDSDGPPPPMRRRRDPHPEWPLRDSHRSDGP